MWPCSVLFTSVHSVSTNSNEARIIHKKGDEIVNTNFPLLRYARANAFVCMCLSQSVTVCVTRSLFQRVLVYRIVHCTLYIVAVFQLTDSHQYSNIQCTHQHMCTKRTLMHTYAQRHSTTVKQCTILFFFFVSLRMCVFAAVAVHIFISIVCDVCHLMLLLLWILVCNCKRFYAHVLASVFSVTYNFDRRRWIGTLQTTMFLCRIGVIYRAWSWTIRHFICRLVRHFFYLLIQRLPWCDW